MTICSLGHKLHYEKQKMEKRIVFRDYNSKDFDKIMTLWELTGMGGKERGDNDEVITLSIETGGKLIIMELNKDIIGTSWLTTDSRRIFLHHFGIHPDYQGKGYANSLMDETMKFIKEKGLQVKLEVHKENIKALSLYRKYDFIDFTEYELMMKRDIEK